MTTEEHGDWGFTDDVLLDTENFTSEARRCRNNDRIRGTIIADANGKLFIEQGPTAGFPDDYKTQIDIVADVAQAFDIAAVGLWCQIRMLNDSGGDQTEMRLGWKLTR